MTLLSDIINLLSWNASMIMLLAKATFILVAAFGHFGNAAGIGRVAAPGS